MKTRTLKNGNIKVWFDREDEYTIVNKIAPLYDTLIDGNLCIKKYILKLDKEIKDAGLVSIHGALIDIDNSFKDMIARLENEEFERELIEFNTLFKAKLSYHVSDQGLNGLMYTHLDSYEDFLHNYFGIFLFKMFALEIDISRSEEQTETLKGLSALISKFADEYMQTYQKLNREFKFKRLITLS